MTGAADHDEFSMLAENAAAVGLRFVAPPPVVRRTFTVAPAQQVSAIVWRGTLPELVLLHGGGQNAHTWDTVALALGCPLIAIDLPGHGHSGRRPDLDYGPWRNAEAVAAVLDQLHGRWPGRGLAVGGMSLGGVTAIRLAALRPDLVRRLIVVDVTPQVRDPEAVGDFTALWDDVAAITMPVMLVRGAGSAFVRDADVDRFRQAQPGLRVDVVSAAGHAVHNQPLALARLIEEFAFA